MKKLQLLLICITFAQLTMAQGVFFTEDFNGRIPTSWRSIEVQGNRTASAIWIWTNTGPRGDFRTAPLASTTASNGWVVFDSDLNCSTRNQEAWLVSPRIDATTRSNVFLSFETYYRSFNDRPTVEVSIDSINWTSFEVFPGVTSNDYGADQATNPQKIQINISQVAAGQRFWFAFRFLSDNTTENGGDGIGCGYSWQIDDVALTDVDSRAPNDLKIDETFYAIAPNLITPASQVVPFGFLADVLNVGTQDQVDAVLKIELFNSSTNASVFAEEIMLPLIESDSTLVDIASEGLFTPQPDFAIYEGVYSVTLKDGQDDNPKDNEQSFFFVTSDTLFSKILDPTTGIRFGGNQLSYAYGSCFYVPNGNGFFGRFVSFFIANAEELTGKSVNILTYKWQGDINGDSAANPEEYGNAPTAFNEYIFTGTEDDWITIPMSIDEIGVPLENDSYYFVVVQYETADAQPMFIGASDEFDYQAAFFRSLLDGQPQYMGMLDVGNTGRYEYFFRDAFTVLPAIDMTIGSNPDIFTKTAEVLAADNETTLFPNPAKEIANLNLKLTTPQDVEVRLLDIKGRLVDSQKLTKVSNANLTFQVSNLAAGSYFLHINAETGTRTLKLTVVE